jgi:hypothetical protein
MAKFIKITENKLRAGGGSIVVESDGAVRIRSATDVVRIFDITNTRGFTFTTTSAGNQTLATSAGDLVLSPFANLQLKDGLNLIGDASNAKMAAGLTINQSANDDEILALKSSDVAHGVTDRTETDTFGFLWKVSATAGGLQIDGLSEGTGGLHLVGTHTTDDTTKTTAGLGAVEIKAFTKSGAGVGGLGVDANISVIRANNVTRFIFDNEGSAHADVEWIAVDISDDLSLIADMEHILVNRESFAQTERRHLLEQAGIIGKDSWHMEHGRPKAMINMTKLAMLHHGALIQSNERIKELERRLWLLEAP